MNLLQFLPGLSAAGNATEWQKMMSQMATQKGQPSAQQNGMGLNTAQSTPVSMMQQPQFTQPQAVQPSPAYPVAPTAPTAQPTRLPNDTSSQFTSQSSQGGAQDPQQVSAFANSLYSSLGKNTGLSYTNPTPGGSAIDQLSALQAQQANDKVGRKGMYAIDNSAGFSPQQVGQQENSADSFYTEQKGKYGAQAQAELAAAKAANSSSNKTSFGDMTSGQASMFNSIVSQYNRSPLVQALDRTPVLKGSIEAIRKNPSDGATQLNLVYSYVQALDTYQSAVREGELGLVNSIDSKVGQLGNFVSQVQNGQIVRPEAILQIADAANNILTTIEGSARRKAKSFESQANTVGLGDAWKSYTGGFDQGFNDGEKAQFDEDTLRSNLQGKTKANGQKITDEEIDAYIEQKRQSFNSVGNTSASNLSKAISSQESNNNYTAVNKDSGALGKYQMMPATIKGLGYNVTPQDFISNPKLQEEAHGKLIAELTQRYNGNVDKILADYYGGPKVAALVGTPEGDRPQGKYPSINAYVAQVKKKLNTA